MTTEAYAKAQQARWNAISALIANHQTEYDELHSQARIAAGLAPQAESNAALKRRVQQLERELNRLTNTTANTGAP